MSGGNRQGALYLEQNYAWERESGFDPIISILYRTKRRKTTRENYNKNIVTTKKKKNGRIRSKKATRDIKSQPEVIRCAKITHEKKANRPTDQDSDWTENEMRAEAEAVRGHPLACRAIDPVHDFLLSFFALDVRFSLSCSSWSWKYYVWSKKKSSYERSKLIQFWYHQHWRKTQRTSRVKQ